ncbi:MAG: S-layer homology domain-containing protein, partial [Acidimicrobiia bacterium]
MKRLAVLSLILSLLLVGTPSLAAPLSGTFSDDDGNVHEPNIQAIAAEAITLGCGGDRYCPAATVRRDEMASFLARALDLAPVGSGPFTDIAGNNHAGAINAIAAAGITLGCTSDRYCPADPVRRDEMASFLARAFDLPAAPSPFTDTAGNVHEENIGAIAADGITLGCAVN